MRAPSVFAVVVLAAGAAIAQSEAPAPAAAPAAPAPPAFLSESANDDARAAYEAALRAQMDVISLADEGLRSASERAGRLIAEARRVEDPVRRAALLAEFRRASTGVYDALDAYRSEVNRFGELNDELGRVGEPVADETGEEVTR